MKTRLSLVPIALGASFLANAAHASVSGFTYDNKTYVVVPTARSVKVAPMILEAHLAPEQPDLRCAEVENEMQKSEFLFKTCREPQNLSVCRVFQTRLRMLAEYRPDTNTPIDASMTVNWHVGAPTAPPVNEAGLKAAVAARFGVKAGRVELTVTGQKPKFGGNPVLLFAKGSPSEKVAEIVTFNPGDLAQVTGDKVITRNRIFACDLAAGRAQITARGVSALRGVEQVPDEVVGLAWSLSRRLDAMKDEINQETSPLVRAAIIGAQIGLLAAERPVDDPLATPAELFRRLYEVKAELPVLKRIDSLEEMRAQLYPDTSYEESIGQDWRLQ